MKEENLSNTLISVKWERDSRGIDFVNTLNAVYYTFQFITMCICKQTPMVSPNQIHLKLYPLPTSAHQCREIWVLTLCNDCDSFECVQE